MKKTLQRIISVLDHFEEVFIVFGLVMMTGLNFANVVSRYFLKSSISFTEELIVTGFVWVSMFGIALGYKKYAHLGMSFFVDKFNPKMQAVFCVFSMFCSLVIAIILVDYGIDMVALQVRLNSKTPVLKLPAVIQGLSIPVGASFIGIRVFLSGVLQAINLWKGETAMGGGNSE